MSNKPLNEYGYGPDHPDVIRLLNQRAEQGLPRYASDATHEKVAAILRRHDRAKARAATRKNAAS